MINVVSHATCATNSMSVTIVQARYEGRIVQQLIRNDGGKGDYIEDTPAMLSIWDTLLKVMM
jgi:hypothetical protein